MPLCVLLDYSTEARNNDEGEEESMENYSVLGSNSAPPEINAYLKARSLSNGHKGKGFNAWAGRSLDKREFNMWAGKRSAATVPLKQFIKMKARRAPWGGAPTQ